MEHSTWSRTPSLRKLCIRRLNQLQLEQRRPGNVDPNRMLVDLPGKTLLDIVEERHEHAKVCVCNFAACPFCFCPIPSQHLLLFLLRLSHSHTLEQTHTHTRSIFLSVTQTYTRTRSLSLSHTCVSSILKPATPTNIRLQRTWTMTLFDTCFVGGTRSPQASLLPVTRTFKLSTSSQTQTLSAFAGCGGTCQARAGLPSRCREMTWPRQARRTRRCVMPNTKQLARTPRRQGYSLSCATSKEHA